MRALLLLALGLIGATPALADEPVVYLDGPADLARLRQVNPGHYARAERILAAANQLCRPAPGRLEEVAGARDLRCESAFLRTSNPPKAEIHFRLDTVRYVALVTITDDPARLMPAHEGFLELYGESR